MVTAVEEELSDDARELNSWLSPLSKPQKRQVWMALHPPHAREELKLAAKQGSSQEVA